MKVGFDRYSDEMKSKVYNAQPGLTGINTGSRMIIATSEKTMSKKRLII